MQILPVFRGAFQCFLLSLLFSVSFSYVNGENTVEVVGLGECADCAQTNIKTSQALSGLHVRIDCKAENGKFQTRGVGKVDHEGNFQVKLPSDLVKDGKFNEECYAQLHSASHSTCPTHSSKLILKSLNNQNYLSGKLNFSTSTCTSKFLWPHFKYPPMPKLPPLLPKWKLPPFKSFGHPYLFPPHPPKLFPPFPPKLCPPKSLPPPVPVYKPPPKEFPPPLPVYKPPPKEFPPPVPVYKPPPKVFPPPVPVYKPPPKVFPPPVPVYKPPPVPVKPLPPPVPIKKPFPPKKYFPPKPPAYKPPPVPVYKPKPPVIKPLPPPVPIYKPKPPVVLPPPVPIYKPKPPVVLPPPVPIYKPKPLPPIPKIPPFHKKPCPPLPKIPPKYFHHPKFGKWPPLPPFSPIHH